MNVTEVQTVDTSHMVDGYDMLHVLATGEIPPTAVTQTDENRRLCSLNGDIRDVDMLHDAAVDYLQRDGRRPDPLSEEFLFLIVAGLHDDARDVDIPEASVGLCAEFDGVAMTAYHTVADADILAESGRGGFQCDAIVIAVGDHPSHDDLMTAVNVEGVVIVVVPVKHHDAVDAEALRAFRENKNRRDLLFVVEQYVGKPLSASELRTICFISGNLKFSDDLIDYLVQYCVDRGKKDFRYIEKVAVNWAENGITTPKQAAAQTNSAPRAGGKKAGKNGTAGSFGSFEQRSYDWNELEKKILGS